MSQPPRRRLRVGCEFVHELEWPVPVVLQVEPRPDAVLVRDATLDVGAAVHGATNGLVPPAEAHRYLDTWGNVCRRFTLGPGRTRIRYEAEVEVDGAVDTVGEGVVQEALTDIPDEVLQFTLPSRFCEADRLGNTAWALFGGIEPGWARAQAVADWVHENITFTTGSTTPMTSATDVYLQRRGVCRDFTQLGVAFLRALNIPARYCFGYLPDIDVPVVDEPMDFVAWLEAYIGGRWYTMDPRNNTPRTGRVLIGRGRDAADIAMLTTFGSAPLVGMRVVAEEAGAPPWSSAARPVCGQFEAVTQ